MCGIGGIINFNHSDKISTSLYNMTNSMISRGPDDEGYVLFSDIEHTSFHGNDSNKKQFSHIKTSYDKNFKAGFGFRHLKIMDLSAENIQPMSDKTANFWIVFNGEIYNYKEIKNELESLGYIFFSDSDTEVVLKSYMAWKEKALQKFNGMFAFTIYDRSKNEVFCARDRIGIKPFYYTQHKNKFIFASTIKSILASKVIPPELSIIGLMDNFKYGTTQGPSTPFSNIYALKPAHYLTINLNNKQVSENNYWSIPTNTQNVNMSLSNACNLLEESLYKAVNYRLNSDNIKTGSFLSGGIDSSLITAFASKNNKNTKCFTLGFQQFKELDEVYQASEIAKKYNLEHIVKQANAKEFIKDINETVLAYEEPYHSISANYQLTKMAHQNNTTVILNGLGGDELFGGYDCYKKLSLWKKIRPFSSLANKLPPLNNKTKKFKEYTSYNNINEFYSHFFTVFSNNEIQELFETEKPITNSLTQYEENLKYTDDFEALSALNLSSYIGNHQTRAIDKTGMAFSIEGRLPFLDHNLIETAFSIPTKYKYNKGIQKYILKQVAKKHLPEAVMKMPKKGLGIPLKHWINNELLSFKNDHIQQLKERNLLSKFAIDKTLNSGNKNKIWQLVSTEIWLQHFFDH